MTQMMGPKRHRRTVTMGHGVGYLQESEAGKLMAAGRYVVRLGVRKEKLKLWK